MEKKKSPIALRIISLILLIGWMGLIFYLSHQNAGESSGMSAGLIKRILMFIIPDADGDKLLNIIASLQFIVRKTAHFTLYAILGVLSFLHFVTYNRIPFIFRNLLSLVISVLYAISDEYHQTYISGRSGELRDVIIDSLGALAGILFSLVICKIHKSIKNRGTSKMKKKQYIELVDTLGRRLNTEKLKNEQLTRENELLTEQISKLKEQILALENPPAAETEKTEILEGISDGAKIIGKIVLSSAKCCNELSAPDAAAHSRELINLILGRTEVAKAEILRLSAIDTSCEERLLAMEREAESTEAYFKSVMAQK